MRSSGGRPVRPPKHQAHIAQLAADYPDKISLQTVDQSRVIPEFHYLIYSSGQCEVRTLPSEFVAPPFVASIKNGLSFGRHCCVIGPAGNAVRETGFNLDGMVDLEGGTVLPIGHLLSCTQPPIRPGPSTDYLPPREDKTGTGRVAGGCHKCD